MMSVFQTRRGRLGLLAGALVAVLGAIWLARPAPAPAPAPAAAARAPARAPSAPGAPADPLQSLLARQSEVSQSMARSMQPGGAGLPAPAPAGAAAEPADKPGNAARAAARAQGEARMRAMRDIQTKAMAEILAVPPGDTKRMLTAMQHFDAQMRAAGAPALIDMGNLRKMLEGAGKMQELNRQLMAEAEKGRNADVAKIKSLSQDITAIQAAMPRVFIKPEVLQRTLAH